MKSVAVSSSDGPDSGGPDSGGVAVVASSCGGSEGCCAAGTSGLGSSGAGGVAAEETGSSGGISSSPASGETATGIFSVAASSAGFSASIFSPASAAATSHQSQTRLNTRHITHLPHLSLLLLPSHPPLQDLPHPPLHPLQSENTPAPCPKYYNYNALDQSYIVVVAVPAKQKMASPDLHLQSPDSSSQILDPTMDTVPFAAAQVLDIYKVDVAEELVVVETSRKSLRRLCRGGCGGRG